MPTTVRGLDTFEKNLRKLARKHPKVLETVGTLITDLENDQRPGDQIPNVGHLVYKVRLPNVSANRGKKGGFRVIYYTQLTDAVVLLTIYSKTEIEDITLDEIQRAVEAATPSDTNSNEPTP